VAIVVNVGTVMGAGISANVTDVNVLSWPRADVAGPHSAGIEASREWAVVSLGRVRVWAKVPLPWRARRRRRGAALAPLKLCAGSRSRTLISHHLHPLVLASCSLSSFAFAMPPLLALPARPRLRRHDVELDTLQRFPRAAPPSRRGGPASSAHRCRRVEGPR
jgi:hypothetical protein